MEQFGESGYRCVALVALLVASCRSPSEIARPNEPHPTAAPSPSEDYAALRSRFRTNLVEHGPSPQPWAPVPRPPGVRELEFESGGLHLTAWLSDDGVTTARPAVLFLHGGFAFGLDDWEMSQPFRDAGFVVMTPILRGENGQPGSYSMFYDEIDDALAAADVLARQPGVDPSRLYVSGHSVGGTLTMLAAMASKRFRAAASLSGSPDQRRFVASQRDLAPFDPEDATELRMRSPLAFPASFKCPARLYFGDREPYFATTTPETARQAKSAGLDVEAVQVKGDHFGMVRPAIELAIAFFKQQR